MKKNCISTEGVLASLADLVTGHEVKGKWTAKSLLEDLAEVKLRGNLPGTTTLQSKEIYSAVRLDNGVPSDPAAVMKQVHELLKALTNPTLRGQASAWIKGVSYRFAEAEASKTLTPVKIIDDTLAKLITPLPGTSIPHQLVDFEMPGKVRRVMTRQPPKGRLTPGVQALATVPRLDSRHTTARPPVSNAPSFNSLTPKQLDDVLHEFVAISQTVSANRAGFAPASAAEEKYYVQAVAGVKHLKTVAGAQTDGSSRYYGIVEDSTDFLRDLVLNVDNHVKSLSATLSGLGVFEFLHAMLRWAKLSLEHLQHGTVSVEAIANTAIPASQRW